MEKKTAVSAYFIKKSKGEGKKKQKVSLKQRSQEVSGKREVCMCVCGGGGGGRLNLMLHLLSPPELFFHYKGQHDRSHFIASLIVRDKVTIKTASKTHTF